MILEALRELGPWAWLLLGLVLLGLELAIPGVFLMWLGLAALTVGALSVLPFADVSWWPWQAQALAFTVLSVLFAMVGHRMLRQEDRREVTTAPLNDRTAQLVGRTATLIEDIDNGVGRVRLGDTVWRVSGPPLAAGRTVRITGAQAETLVVEPA